MQTQESRKKQFSLLARVGAGGGGRAGDDEGQHRRGFVGRETGEELRERNSESLAGRFIGRGEPLHKTLDGVGCVGVLDGGARGRGIERERGEEGEGSVEPGRSVVGGEEGEQREDGRLASRVHAEASCSGES